MDVSTLRNPYDFANPVSNSKLFIGRAKELEEIEYYLKYGKESRPINLAILGPRASGKTSLLNMCELKAKEYGYCTVRIDLNEGDVESEIRFFFKLFDEVFTTAVELGAYGGRTGKTFDTYLNIAFTCKIPEDNSFCPFLFPLQYARNMIGNIINSPIAESAYKRDLIDIQREVDKPIILLFDECNVLVKSRSLLQRLRNIFMNISGFMLVFTGTPDLFPIMDEVFSPIIRQFKKISISGFTDSEATKQCILKPLEEIGIKDFTPVVRAVRDLKDIHILSGGRPYEIQLICHVMFRRLQTKRAKRMALDLGCLEEVLRELESSQDISKRPVLTKIQNLRERHLQALGVLCRWNGRASFEQIWTFEYIFHGNENWTPDDFKKEYEYLLEQAVIKAEGSVVAFAGDDFDEIYCRYLARSQGIDLFFEMPMELDYFVELENVLESNGDDPTSPFTRLQYSSWDRISEWIANPTKTEEYLSNEGLDYCSMYVLMLNFRDVAFIPSILVKLTILGKLLSTWQLFSTPESAQLSEEYLGRLKPISQRASEVGCQLDIERVQIPTIPSSLLIEGADKIDDCNVLAWILFEQITRAAQAYTKDRDRNEALFHAQLAYRWRAKLLQEKGKKISSQYFEDNDLGYLFFSVGEYEKAALLFQAAIDAAVGEARALPSYNLGTLEIERRNLDQALKHINSSIEYLSNPNTSDGEEEYETSDEALDKDTMCLFVPKLIDDHIELDEVWEISLLITARSAKETLENHFKGHPRDVK